MKFFRKLSESDDEGYKLSYDGAPFRYKLGKKVYESGWGKLDNGLSENHVVYELSISVVDPIVKGFEKIKYLSVVFEQHYDFQQTGYSRETRYEPAEVYGYYETVGGAEASEADYGFNGYATLQDAIDNDISKEVVTDDYGESIVNYFTDFDDADIKSLSCKEAEDILEESSRQRKNAKVKFAENAVRIAEAKLRIAKKKLREAELSINRKYRRY